MTPTTEIMTPTTEAVLPDVPLDALDFAGEQDAVWNLRPVLATTKAAFRSAPIQLYLEADPEIANEHRIIIDIDVTGWALEEIAAAEDRWDEMLFSAGVPSGIVGVFCLRLRSAT